MKKQLHFLKLMKIHLQAGDFFKDNLPEADLYILSQVLHDCSEEKIHTLLSKISAVCKPGKSFGFLFLPFFSWWLQHNVNPYRLLAILKYFDVIRKDQLFRINIFFRNVFQLSFDMQCILLLQSFLAIHCENGHFANILSRIKHCKKCERTLCYVTLYPDYISHYKIFFFRIWDS